MEQEDHIPIQFTTVQIVDMCHPQLLHLQQLLHPDIIYGDENGEASGSYVDSTGIPQLFSGNCGSGGCFFTSICTDSSGPTMTMGSAEFTGGC